MIEEDDAHSRSANGTDLLDASEHALVAALRAPVQLDGEAFNTTVMAAVRLERVPLKLEVRRHYGRMAGRLVIPGLGLAAAAMLIVTRLDFRSSAPPAPARHVAELAARSTVHFTLVAAGATRVTVAGSFNGWNTASTPLRRVGRDRWSVDVPLSAGRYVYQFVIDGTRWVSDPRAPRDPAGDFGAANSVVTVPVYGSV
jgi:hypothetical protein